MVWVGKRMVIIKGRRADSRKNIWIVTWREKWKWVITFLTGHKDSHCLTAFNSQCWTITYFDNNFTLLECLCNFIYRCHWSKQDNVFWRSHFVFSIFFSKNLEIPQRKMSLLFLESIWETWSTPEARNS